MKVMIDTKMHKIYKDFSKEISDLCLCELKTIRFDNKSKPDYSQKIVQQLYLLRYFPAYLCEYKYLYEKVIFTNKIDHFNILSVGCGCCIDYYSAFLALGSKVDCLTYWGIDAIDWAYRDSLDNSNFHFVLNNICNARFSDKPKFNLIFFPKSLSEITDDDFNLFLKKIAKPHFISNRIFLISSIMNKGYTYDSTRYNEVADVLRAKSFICSNFKSAQEIKIKGGLKRLDSDFDYPDDIKLAIITLNEHCKGYKENGKNCKDDCITQLNRWPILTSTYLSFQLNLFER
jgi:hypothetical protein